MATTVNRTNSIALVTLDRSDCGRYSIIGPMDASCRYAADGTYAVRDHEEDTVLGRGTRDDMIRLVEAL